MQVEPRPEGNASLSYGLPADEASMLPVMPRSASTKGEDELEVRVLRLFRHGELRNSGRQAPSAERASHAGAVACRSLLIFTPMAMLVSQERGQSGLREQWNSGWR
jgi:hypothetical protein